MGNWVVVNPFLEQKERIISIIQKQSNSNSNTSLDDIAKINIDYQKIEEIEEQQKDSIIMINDNSGNEQNDKYQWNMLNYDRNLWSCSNLLKLYTEQKLDPRLNQL